MFNWRQKINSAQQLFTADQWKRLVDNHKAAQEGPGGDGVPVVKLFNGFGQHTWLLTECDPESGKAFGLCCLGMGFPEIGYVSMPELLGLKPSLKWNLERDLHFSTVHGLETWANACRFGQLCGVTESQVTKYVEEQRARAATKAVADAQPS